MRSPVHPGRHDPHRHHCRDSEILLLFPNVRFCLGIVGSESRSLCAFAMFPTESSRRSSTTSSVRRDWGRKPSRDKLTVVLATMQIYVAGGLVAQCYDGASTMSGRLHCVQQRMRESVCPLGIFIHCWAHRLNLVVVSVSELTTKIAKHFDHLRTLHKFFSSSVPHDKFIEVQKEVYRDNADERGQALQIKELKSLSKTRWSCQGEPLMRSWRLSKTSSALRSSSSMTR